MSESSTWKRAAVVASLSVGSYIIFKTTRPSKSKPKYALWGKQVELDIPKQVFPTDAELQAMESTMPQCQHGWFESTSGLQLHYRKFLPSAEKLKGVVVYQHGIQTHSGKSFVMKETGRKLNMALMSERLLKAGYAVYGLDMLGHGYSEGDRWYIPDWVVNRDDLDNFAHFVSAQHANVPLFLEGESYGGTLVLHVAKKWQLDSNHAPNEFAGIILSGPAIMADVPPFPVYVLLRYVLAPAYPKWIPFFMPNPISPDRIWVDEKVRALHVAPRNKEMCIDGSGRPFRLGTAVNMLHALELARSTIIPGLNVPFCVIHGVKDEGCPVEGTYYLDEIAETAAEDRSYHRLEKAYHDLLGDPAAEQTMEYMVDFMNKQVAKQK